MLWITIFSVEIGVSEGNSNRAQIRATLRNGIESVVSEEQDLGCKPQGAALHLGEAVPRISIMISFLHSIRISQVWQRCISCALVHAHFNDGVAMGIPGRRVHGSWEGVGRSVDGNGEP